MHGRGTRQGHHCADGADDHRAADDAGRSGVMPPGAPAGQDARPAGRRGLEEGILVGVTEQGVQVEVHVVAEPEVQYAEAGDRAPDLPSRVPSKKWSACRSSRSTSSSTTWRRRRRPADSEPVSDSRLAQGQYSQAGKLNVQARRQARISALQALYELDSTHHHAGDVIAQPAGGHASAARRRELPPRPGQRRRSGTATNWTLLIQKYAPGLAGRSDCGRSIATSCASPCTS